MFLRADSVAVAAPDVAGICKAMSPPLSPGPQAGGVVDAFARRQRGVVKGSEHAAKEGEKVTVHYTEEAMHKVVHFIRTCPP